MRIGQVGAVVGLVASALGALACSSSSSSTGTAPKTTGFILVQAAKRLGSAGLTVDGASVVGNVGVDQVAKSADVAAGSHTLKIVGSATLPVAGGFVLLSSTVYDVLAVDSVGHYSPQILPNITYDTASKVGHFRFVHAATSLAGDSLNVYVTPAGVPSDSALHDSATAVISQLGFPLNQGYTASPAGTYEIRVSNYAFPDTVLARATGVVLTTGQLKTIVTADGATSGATILVVSDK